MPHWAHCESTADCVPTNPQGQRLACHVGDRRCLTVADCAWANAVDQTSRNCDAIADGLRGGYAPAWAPCNASSDCDPAPWSDYKLSLWCHRGDRRCLADIACVLQHVSEGPDKTLAICEHEVDRCFNGVKDGSEPSVDCGGDCTRKCKEGQLCLKDTECEHGFCVPQWNLRPVVGYCN
eukprot:m51a1_g14363 hypothetical protein (179) ;mRNA; r:227077-227613